MGQHLDKTDYRLGVILSIVISSITPGSSYIIGQWSIIWPSYWLRGIQVRSDQDRCLHITLYSFTGSRYVWANTSQLFVSSCFIIRESMEFPSEEVSKYSKSSKDLSVCPLLWFKSLITFVDRGKWAVVKFSQGSSEVKYLLKWTKGVSENVRGPLGRRPPSFKTRGRRETAGEEKEEQEAGAEIAISEDLNNNKNNQNRSNTSENSKRSSVNEALSKASWKKRVKQCVVLWE